MTVREVRLERVARHVLFDDLQVGWPDATFASERDRLEEHDRQDGDHRVETRAIGRSSRRAGAGSSSCPETDWARSRALSRCQSCVYGGGCV